MKSKSQMIRDALAAGDRIGAHRSNGSREDVRVLRNRAIKNDMAFIGLVVAASALSLLTARWLARWSDASRSKTTQRYMLASPSITDGG